MILIIDDDIAVRTSLQLLIKSEGFEVMTADGPTEAISILEKHYPELIILDLNFSMETSGKEGLDLLKQIRHLHPIVPVVLITGWGSIELAVQGMKLGANDFINKPWNNEHLLQSIKTLLDLQENKKQKLTGSNWTAL